MATQDPRGAVHEVVGYMSGSRHTSPRRAVIVAVTKTTATVDLNGERITFNTSNWQKRGSGNSHYAPYLVNEVVMEHLVTADRLEKMERQFSYDVRQQIEKMVEKTRYRQSSEDLAALALELEELTETVRVRALDMQILENMEKAARAKRNPHY